MKNEPHFKSKEGGVQSNALPEGITTLPEYIGGEIVPPIGTLPPVTPVPPIGSLPIVQFPGGNQGVLSICMEKVSYIWMRNEENFWFFPMELSNNSLIGYRYNDRAGWFNYSIPFQQIMAVTCVQS